MRRLRASTWSAVLSVAIVAAGCSPALRRTDGGQGKAFATIMFGQRIGDEMNEGRGVRGAEYCRAIPILGYIFKACDGFSAGGGRTGLERGRLSDLDPPNSYPENLDLLLEARKLGIIDKVEFDRTVEKSILQGRNFNYVCLKFLRRHCSELLPEGAGVRLVRRLRWDRDFHVYAMDDGLMDELAKLITPKERYLFYQQILRFCAMTHDGRRLKPIPEVKPIPWALKIARRETFLTQHEYEERLRFLLEKYFDKRLEDEEEEDEEPEIRGEGGWGPFLAGVFIGPRVGYSVNEGRGIRGIEYVRVIPLFGLIAEIQDGFAAFKGRTANLAAWDADLDPLAVRWEWVDLLDQCKAAGVLGPDAYNWRLNRLALASYTNVKLLKKAYQENAIDREQYKDALRRIAKEEDWPLNPLNVDFLAEAVDNVKAIRREDAKKQLKEFLDDEVPGFNLLRWARQYDVLLDSEYKQKVAQLYERIYK